MSGGSAPPGTVATSAAATLRPLRWRDIPALAGLESDLFGPAAWSEQTWWAELAERPRRAYTVLEDPDGSVAGYAGLDLAGDVADVMTVAVAPAARGRGAGHVLLRWAAATAAAAGAEHLMLEVRADNAPALGLYRHHGFRVLHTRRRYYQPEGVDALVMRADLADLAAAAGAGRPGSDSTPEEER